MNNEPMSSESDSNNDDTDTIASAPIEANPAATMLMHQVDDCLSHVWMVRTFLKHSDEASDDEELAEVHRGLYDFMLALGPSYEAHDANRYLKIARKKLGKLKSATAAFQELQPEVSGHMNFRMANKSLTLAVKQIARLLETSSDSTDGK
jgi:hypothetical protein